MNTRYTAGNMDGWTLIYRNAKQAHYAAEAIRQGADEDCVGPGEEGWYWYHEGTGQVGGRVSLPLAAAAPELLEALKLCRRALGGEHIEGLPSRVRALVAKVEGA